MGRNRGDVERKLQRGAHLKSGVQVDEKTDAAYGASGDVISHNLKCHWNLLD